jgi:5-methylcytosine-specific restriction endonuclease McrA
MSGKRTVWTLDKLQLLKDNINLSKKHLCNLLNVTRQQLNRELIRSKLKHLERYSQTEEHKKNFNMTAKQNGQGKWNKGKKRTLEQLINYKKPKSKEHIKKVSEGLKKAYDIKGRKTYKRYIHLTNTVEYKTWRESVFIRDNYTCQKCNAKGYIEAHHIKLWCDYPELRFLVDNGITLCKPCHKNEHKTYNK